MMPSMSSDRLMAYRVFTGELHKLEALNNGEYTEAEMIVRDYLKERIDELVYKGHDFMDADDSWMDEN